LRHGQGSRSYLPFSNSVDSFTPPHALKIIGLV
jgi:hypothetical protein